MTPLIPATIRTIELVAWDLDTYEARSQTPDCERLLQAYEAVSGRRADHLLDALCEEQTSAIRQVLKLQESRSDLQVEMLGLDWSLGVIDLRRLLTFQRRLSFHSVFPETNIPLQSDWRSLMEVAFAPPNPVAGDLFHDASSKTITLRSSNPNLHLRVTQNPATPVAVHAGSPFFEVAQYAGRWFLRDGHHRAYHLLRAGVFHMPAVIVRAKTLEELGADRAHFFPEAVLVSQHPPFVSDFLDDRLTMQYDRLPAIKTLRITLDESIAYPTPFTISGEQP
jgi:hypothetical protein